MRLLSFFKQIPEFSQLNVDDKVILIKYNALIAMGISCALSFDPERGQILETETDKPWNTEFRQLTYGYAIFKRVVKIFCFFLNIAKYDQKIIELALIVVILTSGLSTTDSSATAVNDRKATYCAQKYYIELLWKYLEATLGLEEAIRLYGRFVNHILSWQMIQEEVREHTIRVLSPQDIEDLLPIMKAVLRIE